MVAVSAFCATRVLAQPMLYSHVVAVFPAASSQHREGVARIINRSEQRGKVYIAGIDDAGREHGPIELSLEARASAHFTSTHLEAGDPERGLAAGLGDGEGDWRLHLSSELDIEALSYIRTEDGFVTAMHQVVPAEGTRHHVRFFNPGSNWSQVSRLRLVNPTESDAAVTIEGRDDNGESAPGGAVHLTLRAGEARSLTAQALESGAPGLDGSLGDGEGRWQIFVSADRALHVMSLLQNPTGHLSNLSADSAMQVQARSGSERTLGLMLFPAASSPYREGVARIINRSGEPGKVHIAGIDDAGREHGPIELSLEARASAHFTSTHLEAGDPERGLAAGLGDGEGDWRLHLSSELDIEALSYIRTEDGFVTAMHQVVPAEGTRHHVRFFNPGSNWSQVSRLRLVNPTESDAAVTIEGRDDNGESAPGGAVHLTLRAGEARSLTAQALESGAPGLDGSLGDGEGRWQIFVSADRALHVMSLLQNPTGHLTNLSATPASAAGGARNYQGRIAGYTGDFDDVDVVLSSRDTLRTTHPDSTGRFFFRDLDAGEYVVKIHASGYQAVPARIIRIPSRSYEELFLLERLATNPFVFHWEEDQSTAGYDYAAHVNQPPRIEFLGEPVDVADDASSVRLRHDYNVLLVDSDGGSWSQEHAYRLLAMMKSVPQDIRDANSAQTRPPSRWQLTAEYIEHDIAVTRHDDGSRSVLISESAFVNASPRVATVDGKRGIWFSRRLHHAVVRFVTDNGRDDDAYEKILQERFGLTTRVDDYYALTAPTGHESAARFQSFHAEEIVQIINMLEEMPKGMHKVPGFRTLVRRLDGTPHPLYLQAPAVAWPDHGYVEFMDRAFLSGSVQHMHRLVIHEKAHFLWAHLFDDQLKEKWIELGGWYRDESSPSGWFTTKQTEFVSAYAHAKNPNEDMAESIAFFVVNPDKLKSRAIGKYEFVRDRIMEGSIYLSRIREDLTFQVYNLFPDYVFPGKIRRVDIRVEGVPEADKTIFIEIELHALDHAAEGAVWARTRISSDAGTYFDLYLYPEDEFGQRAEQGVVLKGRHTLSRYAKAGYWLPNQFTIRDSAGNERFERTNDFGWKLYVDNPMEDVVPPEYVAGTAALSLSTTTVENHNVQVIRASWQVVEENPVRLWGCYASMNDEIPETYRFEEYGNYDEAGGRCRVDFLMPDYMPSSMYSLDFILMRDAAENFGWTRFTGDFSRGEHHEAPQRIELVTANPDTEPPEVAINEIDIDAEPTNFERPNGETVVTIRFLVRDNISGYTHTALNLRDPQGVEHFAYAYADDRSALFPSDDPTRWKRHTFVHILPPGSAPGIWGLAEMTVYDRAENFRQYDFTEIIHFEVE